jgi:hypothetical protein
MNRCVVILLVASLLSGCTTWGYKSRTGAYYPPTKWQNVKVLWQPPARGTYDEIGMVSVLGGAAFITSDVDMFNKLRKAAADLGADAVIVMKDGMAHAAMVSGGGNQYAWSVGGGAYDYPRNFGIAIRWKHLTAVSPPGGPPAQPQ